VKIAPKELTAPVYKVTPVHFPWNLKVVVENLNLKTVTLKLTPNHMITLKCKPHTIKSLDRK
jgi:hypothetical protein